MKTNRKNRKKIKKERKKLSFIENQLCDCIRDLKKKDTIRILQKKPKTNEYIL